MKTRFKTSVAGMLAGMLTAASPAVAGHYVFTDLGSPGCCSSLLSGLNDHGKALGFTDTTDGGSDPSFVASGSKGKFTTIGASVAFAETGNLTDRGLAVGTSQTSGAAYIVNVHTGALTMLPNVSPYSTAPAQINASGAVVGVALNSGASVSHGYLYSGGAASLFDPPDSLFTTASVINAAGEIAGSYQATKRTQKVFTYAGGQFTTYAVPGAVELLVVNAIDSTGDLAGQYTDSSGKKNGFVVMSGKVTTIDYPGAEETNFVAFGPGGELVGYSVDDNADSTSHGLIYLDGNFTQVDDPKESMFGSVLSAVNASGELAGEYFDGNGFGHPFTAVCPAAQAPCTN